MDVETRRNLSAHDQDLFWFTIKKQICLYRRIEVVDDAVVMEIGRASEALGLSVEELEDFIDLRMRDEAASHHLVPAHFWSRIPSRQTTADTLLIFVTDPDRAEAILGDLLENMVKVRARKSAFVTWLWFWWEITWVLTQQGGERIRENTILGRLADALVRRISG